MKLHRFIGPYDLKQKNLVLSDKDVIHQLRDVLRLKSGDFFILSNGQKEETVARIENIDDKIKVSLGELIKNKNEPEVISALYCAILKKENFEHVVQKATEIGISKIIPVITERTIKTKLNTERLSVIAREAAEQSGRGVVPKIEEPLNLKEAVLEAKRIGLVCAFDGRGKSVKDIKIINKETGGFIGPEGGFSDEELLIFESAGFQIVNLGPLTLRAETAAIIASYLIAYLHFLLRQ